ncbi:MAG: 4-(cytidine 5'-diphospho)-2-C-methyl-D-erythritol kinase [Ignavibacteriales bacterium]|nr:4-(cytidine 5'-diphospho)-2-C-methyl-D-erythritol kinase [Ignavibacteriales bacterium]
MRFIEIKAPAKINIGLFILSKRADGYHNLLTLFYPIHDLFDLLTFERSSAFEFICSEKNIPCDENNLVVKAKSLLEKVSGKSINVKITLDKRIPSQAGLGGGSSDAAAALISLNEMFQLNLKYEQLLELALQLGSDVPFFIKARPAIGRSRGEILQLAALEINEPILIINPGINISTKEAFAKINPHERNFDFTSVIKNGTPDYSLLKEKVTNDFEEHVFELYPEIKRLKEILYTNGALFSLMSGSGSTVYGIFPDVESAERVKELLPKNYFCLISNPDR